MSQKAASKASGSSWKKDCLSQAYRKRKSSSAWLKTEFFILVVLTAAALLLVSCDEDIQPTSTPAIEAATIAPTVEQPQEEASAVQEEPTEPPPTPTEIPPTPTPEPMAAQVNGKPILLADLEKEVARYNQAREELGLSTEVDAGDAAQIVLDALIETEIIAQAAEANGIQVTEQMVLERIAQLKESSGGAESFAEWLLANHWTEEEFQKALGSEMVTEKMIALVTADVPFAVEQVHARYLQVDDSALAQSLLEQARGGVEFASLAQQYSLDRVTGEDGGDLGFFALGSLLVPEVEEAAFGLQPGELSDVIEAPRSDGTGTAYYIVLLIERDPEREIAASHRSLMLQETFELWLDEQLNQAEVIKYVGEDQ